MDGTRKIRRLITPARTLSGDPSRVEVGLISVHDLEVELFAQSGDGEEVILAGPQSVDDVIANLNQLRREKAEHDARHP